MRAVAYPRVSSALQRERDTIESQRRVLPEFAARMGWELVRPVETYIADAVRWARRRGFRVWTEASSTRDLPGRDVLPSPGAVWP